MTTLTLGESVNKTRLSAIIDHDDLTNEERIILKKYFKNIKSNSKINVSYFKNFDMGRQYAKQALSLQMFSKKIRHTLTYDTHIDVDIVNCHLVLLSQYCKKNNISCPFLDSFNKERNIRLQEIMTTCNVSKKIAKEFILTIMYLGNSTNYCTSNGFDQVIPKWCDDLELEFKNIAELIVGKHQDIFKTVSATRKKEFTNKKASTVSFVLQIIENDLIMNAMKYFTENKYQVETLCFDGLMILKKDITKKQFEELNLYCFHKTGYNVEFEIKPMTNMLNIDDCEDVDYDYDHTDYYNQEYCANLEGNSQSQTYQIKKKYIELFLCKIITPDTCFILQNGDDKEPYIYNATSVSMLLKPIQSGYLTTNGCSISFWDKWSQDPKQRIYRKYDFIPYNMVKPRADIFNMFLGMNKNIYTEPHHDIDKMIKPWFDLVRELCGGCDKDADYLHKFFANIFQEPLKRPPISIIIKGKQGTGKNIMLDAIGNMIDREHYITTSDPKTLFGDHAEGFYRKLLVNLNEAEGKGTFDYEGKIKSFISEDTITVNPKFVRPTEVSNLARLVITTNKETPIPIDVKSKDRRYVVYKTTDEYLKYSQSFWGKLYNHFRKPEFMASLHKYYMDLDLNEFDWIKNRPITKAYREMCSLYSPIEALFLEDYISNQRWIMVEHDNKPINEDKSVDVKCIDFFDAYSDYCRTNKFYTDNCPNSRAFGGRMTGLNLPIEKYRRKDTTYWTFKPNEVYKFMEQQRWINDFGDNLVVENDGVDEGDDYFA